MRRRTGVLVVCVVAGLASPRSARAQTGSFELGTSLLNVLVEKPEFSSSAQTVLATGGSVITLPNPSVYVALFARPRLAIEPQLGLFVVSDRLSTDTVASISGQVDYFTRSTAVDSPYVFGTAGALLESGAGITPTFIGGGGGYRHRAGDRLVFRVDARLDHVTDGRGTILGLAVSLGGVFGR